MGGRLPLRLCPGRGWLRWWNPSYQGTTHGRLGDCPPLNVRAHTLVDPRLGAKVRGGAGKLALSMRNVGDVYCWTAANRTLAATVRPTAMPRAFGVTLACRYQ